VDYLADEEKSKALIELYNDYRSLREENDEVNRNLIQNMNEEMRKLFKKFDRSLDSLDRPF